MTRRLHPGYVVRLPFPACTHLVVLFCCASSAGAAGLDATTALEAGPFSRADAVVAVQVLDVTDIRAPGGALGRQIVRARVLRAMKGTAAARSEITVQVRGQRPTLDPARPSVPYFRKGLHNRYVLFLTRTTGRFVYQLQTLYDAQDRTGAEKIKAVDAVALWARETDPKVKAAKTLKGLLTMIKSRGRWAPGHAARELAYLAQLHPEIFDRRTLGQLTRLGALGGTSDMRFWIRRVAQLVSQSASPSGKGSGKGKADGDPWRVAFTGAPGPEDRKLLLSRLLRTGGETFDKQAWWAWNRIEPSLRGWFVEALVLAKARKRLPRLRGLYGGEEDGEVRAAIVRAVGLLGSKDDVAWLTERLAGATVRRQALIALARIRTTQALASLRAARQDRPADEVRWIDHLLSKVFVESERRAGR